jgi:ubiquinone/menaquinone biosynthesis C-methylase UbiE
MTVIPTPTDEWWQSFYASHWSDQHLAGSEPSINLVEGEFIQDQLHVSPGDLVLDVACGHGRLTAEMGRRGLRCLGVDASRELLHQAQSRSEHVRGDMQLVRADMRHLPWRDRFDGAFCFSGTFGYLHDAGNQAVLDSVARTLKIGRRFLLDAQVAETAFVQPAETVVSRGIGDSYVLRKRSYDPANGTLAVRWVSVTEGRKSTRYTWIRLYGIDELTAMFRRAGFGSIEVVSTWGKPFEAGDSRVFIVGTRQG